MSRSAASSSPYDGNAFGIVHVAAYAWPRAASRLATADTTLRSDARLTGMISLLIRAVPSRPQRSKLAAVAAETRGEDRLQVRFRSRPGEIQIRFAQRVD